MVTELSILPYAEHSPVEVIEGKAADTDAMRQAAKDFEASYIAQMLTFSGLDKALTTGGGEDMSAFTSFYIQSFAEDIAESGGFGLADKFYSHMLKVSGADAGVNVEDSNVDFGKL